MAGGVTLVVFTLALTFTSANTARINRKAKDQNSTSRSGTGCDVLSFVHFTLGGMGGMSMFTGGLRKQAANECVARYAANGRIRTIVNYEAKWMHKRCQQGVEVGHKLCQQIVSEESDASIVPLDIVDHFDSRKPQTAAGITWKEWEDEMCAADPKPRWTGFQHCYHACQYLHPDCEQTGKGGPGKRCKICANEGEAETGGKCDGIRKKTVYKPGKGPDDADGIDWSVQPDLNYMFMDACVSGCAAYTDLKKEKGGGTACKRGARVPMQRTLADRDFWKRCKAGGGKEEDNMCVCRGGLECIGTNGNRSKSSVGQAESGCQHERIHEYDMAGSYTGFTTNCQTCKCG